MNEELSTPSQLSNITALDLKKHLMRTYTQKIMEREVQIHLLRKSRIANRITRFFNSTSNRNVLARLMTLAAYSREDDKNFIGYTKTEVAKKIGLSMPAVTEMWKTYLS